MTESPRRTGPTTISDVADLAGVSVATVSRALRGFDNVSPATMDRVREAAAALHYRPNQQASRLRSGASRAISLVVPSVESWYGSEVMAGAETVLTEAAYDTLVTTAPDAEAFDRIVATAQPRWGRVDGLIIVDYALSDELVDRLQAWDCPLVVVGESTSGFSSVRIDDRQVGFDATQHLLDQGHRRIGLIEGVGHRDDRESVPHLRAQGYRDALAAAGIEVDPTLTELSTFGVDGSDRAVAALFARPEPPTALVCMSDLTAVGAMRTLKTLGFAVPDDISIVGVDDQEVAEVVGLTTVRQPVAEIGVSAARLLLDQMGGGSDRPGVTLPIELVLRATTAPVSD